MFKKFMSLALALVMALGLVAGAVDYKDADDIADYAEEAVQFVYDLNIMQGDNHGNFNPKKPITREEMFRVMYALYNAGDINVSSLYEATLDRSGFQDAGEVNTWARKFAGYNIAKGIFKGSGVGGYLRPKANISYEEVAVLILRTLGYKDEYFVSYNPLFGWGQNAMLLAHELGITAGLPSSIDPTAPATREDVAVMVTNALGTPTVHYDKDDDLYYAGASLLEVMYDIDLDEDEYKLTGIVAGFITKEGAKTEDITDLYPDFVDDWEDVTVDKYGAYIVLLGDNDYYFYNLSSSESYNSDLLGKKVEWSFRKGQDKPANRINKLAAVANGAVYEDVRLDKFVIKSAKELEINGTKVKFDKNANFFTVGNGVPFINIGGSVPSDESLKVDIVVNKVDGDIYVGIIGVYEDDFNSLPTYGVGVVEKIDGNFVVIKVASSAAVNKKLVYIADELNDAEKGDAVFFEVSYEDALLLKNSDSKVLEAAKKLSGNYSGAEKLLANVTVLEVFEGVSVANNALVKKTVGGNVTYYLDGKAVKVSEFAQDGFDIDTYVALSKDSKATIFVRDNYVYGGSEGVSTSKEVKNYYGLFVKQYYNANGAFVELLTEDGKVTAIPVSKVRYYDDEENEHVNKATKTTKPIGFDENGLAVWGIKQLSKETASGAENDIELYTPFTYTADGEKYIVTINKFEPSQDDKGYDVADFEPIGGDSTLSYGSKASERTLAGVRYNSNTVFFVVYGETDDVKAAVIRQSDIKATQDEIKGGFMLVNKSGVVDVVTYAYIDLVDVEVDLFDETEEGDVIVLTEPATVVKYNDRYEVSVTGIVKGKVTTFEYVISVKQEDYEEVLDDVLALDLLSRVSFNVQNGKLVKVADKPFDYEGKVTGFDAELGVIELDDEDVYDLKSDAKFFYFDEDGELVDAYDIDEVLDNDDLQLDAYLVTDKDLVTELYFVINEVINP